MKYIAAYLLAVLGGNASPNVSAIAKILGSVGIECDENLAQKVIDACQGRDVNDIIANGMTKIDLALANTPAGTNNSVDTPSVPQSNPPPRPPTPASPSPPGSPTFIDLFD